MTALLLLRAPNRDTRISNFSLFYALGVRRIHTGNGLAAVWNRKTILLPLRRPRVPFSRKKEKERRTGENSVSTYERTSYGLRKYIFLSYASSHKTTEEEKEEEGAAGALCRQRDEDVSSAKRELHKKYVKTPIRRKYVISNKDNEGCRYNRRDLFKFISERRKRLH